MLRLHNIVCFQNIKMKHSMNRKKKHIVKRLYDRQQTIEKHSLRVLEQLNQCSSVSDRQKLSLELTYLCKNILDLQEQIENIDTYLLLYDTENKEESDMDK